MAQIDALNVDNGPIVTELTSLELERKQLRVPFSPHAPVSPVHSAPDSPGYQHEAQYECGHSHTAGVELCTVCFDVPCCCSQENDTTKFPTGPSDGAHVDGKQQICTGCWDVPCACVASQTARAGPGGNDRPPWMLQPEPEASLLCLHCMDTTCRCGGPTGAAGLCGQCFDIPCCCARTMARIADQDSEEGQIYVAGQQGQAHAWRQTEGVEEFFAAAAFAGPQPGLVFKSGARGVGYYADCGYMRMPHVTGHA
jgi:hypothetical protein